MNDSEKFKNWLTARGVEIIPCTNEHEDVRFKGREIGVLYKSGKVANEYTLEAFRCFIENKRWDGKPVNTGRYRNYKNEKAKLLQRDGSDCFYCGKSMKDDISLEHLIALSSGGQNSLSNMVLCHEKCNQEVENKPISEKVKLAIKKRLNHE